MNMLYKLLDNGSGVILSRTPQGVQKSIKVTFKDAPKNALAVFEYDNGQETYKMLENEECTIIFPRKSGVIKVAVILNKGSAIPPKWLCNRIKT